MLIQTYVYILQTGANDIDVSLVLVFFCSTMHLGNLPYLVAQFFQFYFPSETKAGTSFFSPFPFCIIVSEGVLSTFQVFNNHSRDKEDVVCVCAYIYMLSEMSDRERHFPCGLTYTWILKNKIRNQNENRFTDTENELVFPRMEGDEAGVKQVKMINRYKAPAMK